MTPIRIGTRGSRLALWQAEHVAGLLRAVAGGRPIELVEITTAGDQVRDVPLAQLGGEGVFTKEIQRALLDRTVDLAVHSLKDLPTVAVAGLLLAAVPERAPVADALIAPRHRTLAGLPQGATVATSSLRRRAQLLNRRPDLQVVSIRGNVETRLRKLEAQQLDALVLAEAGLERLGLGSVITERLDTAWMYPAVGQGALGLECREDDDATRALLASVDHAPTHQAVRAERALLRALGGGCQMPVGVVTRHQGERLSLRSAVVSPDGSRRLEAAAEGPATDAEGIGRALAADLLRLGAAELLGSVGG